MTTEQLKEDYYLERTYKEVSDTELNCKLTIIRKADKVTVTGIQTKINILEVGQDISDSQFQIYPITWETYLDETIIMQFNLLMLRINLTDLHNTEGKKNIADFFIDYPFHED
ncbi:hypothetical protein [Flavobacterium beibuense]|uniref:hypothetical protein n=1 Tax=Flavobacterium beibuense TaxID=657326 RepID=UPI00101B98E5|nr:hypothetical protein [Flavobacterium beibuense]